MFWLNHLHIPSLASSKTKVSTRDLSLRRDVEITNEVEFESTHVGVPTGAHLRTKPAAHIGFVLKATRAKQEVLVGKTVMLRFLCSSVMSFVSCWSNSPDSLFNIH